MLRGIESEAIYGTVYSHVGQNKTSSNLDCSIYIHIYKYHIYLSVYTDYSRAVQWPDETVLRSSITELVTHVMM